MLAAYYYAFILLLAQCTSATIFGYGISNFTDNEVSSTIFKGLPLLVDDTEGLAPSFFIVLWYY